MRVGGTWTPHHMTSAGDGGDRLSGVGHVQGPEHRTMFSLQKPLTQPPRGADPEFTTVNGVQDVQGKRVLDTEITSDDKCARHVKFHQNNEIDSFYARATFLPSLFFCAILANQRIFDGFIVALREQL